LILRTFDDERTIVYWVFIKFNKMIMYVFTILRIYIAFNDNALLGLCILTNICHIFLAIIIVNRVFSFILTFLIMVPLFRGLFLLEMIYS